MSIGDAGGIAKVALLLWRWPREEDPLALRFSVLSAGGLRVVGRRWLDSRFSSSAILNAASGMGSIAAVMRSGVPGRGVGGTVNSLLNESGAMARGVKRWCCCAVVVVAEVTVGRRRWEGSLERDTGVNGSHPCCRTHF